MLILEFETEDEAQSCLKFIDEVLAPPYWESLSYIVQDNKLIGKNAKTHQDAFDKTKTTTWALIIKSPVNTYYFQSLTGTPFENGMQSLKDAGFSFVEKELPSAWFDLEFNP